MFNLVFSKEDKSKMLALSGENTELEVRFGIFGDHFFPGISIMNYKNIKNFFSDNSEFEIFDEETISKISGNTRLIKNIKNSDIKYEKKSLLFNIDNREWGVRISAHKEENIPVSTTTNKSNFDRKKSRLSIVCKNPKNAVWRGLKIDLTIVIETKGKSKTQKYEVEIEKIENSVTIDQLTLAIKELLLISQSLWTLEREKEDFLLSQSAIAEVKRKWNESIPAALGIHDDIYFHEYISRARDITMDDFLTLKESFITAKLDGLRKFLFLLQGKVYEIFPPLEIRYLGECSNKEIHVLDTEFLKDQYYVFDVLVLNGESFIQKTPFTQRLQKLEIFFSNNEIENVKMLKLKGDQTYLKSTTLEDFQSQAKECLIIMKEKNILNDGIIIQGAGTLYVNQPPIYLKWKPSDQLNIDFYVKSEEEDSEEFSLYYLNTNVLEKFSGTGMYPYEKTVHFPQGKFLNEPVNGSIIEFCFKDGNFQPLRIRREKTRPNGRITIYNIWDLIKNPVSKETLTGQNNTIEQYNLTKHFYKELAKKPFMFFIFSQAGLELKLLKEEFGKKKNKYIVGDYDIDSIKHIKKESLKTFLLEGKCAYISSNLTDEEEAWVNRDLVTYYSQKGVKMPFFMVAQESILSEGINKNMSYVGYKTNPMAYRLYDSEIYNYPVGNFETCIIQQPATGSCFYHCILYALYKEYRYDKNKLNLTKIFRNKLANSMFEEINVGDEMMEYLIEMAKMQFYESFIQKLSTFYSAEKVKEIAQARGIEKPDVQLPNEEYIKKVKILWTVDEAVKFTTKNTEFSKDDWRKMAINSLQNKLKNPTEFADEITVRLIEKFLKINIIIVDSENKNIMQRQNIYNKKRPTIVFLIMKDVHYDLLGLKEGDELKTVFNDGDKFINFLTKNLK